MTTRRTTIHYGSGNQGKIETLLDSFPSGRNSELQDWRVLLPNRFRKSNFLEWLHPSVEALFSPPVWTIREQLADLFRRLAPGFRILSEFEKRSLLMSLLGRSDPALSPGRVAQVSRLIAAIKSQNITDPELLRLKLRQEKTRLTEADEENLSFFGTYQQELSRLGLEDWEGGYCQVHDGLTTGRIDLSRIHPGIRCMVVELPVLMTPIEASILVLLASPVQEVHLLVPVEHPRATSELPGWRFLQKLDAEATVHESPIQPPRVVRHPGDRAEVAWVAEEVRRILDQEGNAARIGIVSSLTPGLQAELVREFEKRGIETTCSGLAERGSSAISQAFLQYVRLLQSNFGRVELFDFLAESRVKPGFDSACLKRLEEVALRAGIEAGPEEWDSRLAEAGAALRRELNLEEESVALLLALIRELQVETASGRPFGEWYRTCAERLHPHLEMGQLEGGEGRWLARFREAVRLQSEIWDSQELSFAEFVLVFRQCLIWQKELPAQPAEGVWVGGPEEFQNCRLAHLYWVGLSAEAFPEMVADPLAEEEIPGPFRTASYEQRFGEGELLFQNLVAESASVTCSFHERSADRGMEVSPFLSGLQAERMDSRERTAAVSSAAAGNIERGLRVQTWREDSPLSPYSGFLIDSGARAVFRERLWTGEIKVTPSRLEHYASCGFRFLCGRILGLGKRSQIGSGPGGVELGKLIHRILYRFRGSGFVDPGSCPPDQEPEWMRLQSARMRRITGREIDRLRARFEWGRGLFWEHAEQRLLGGLGGDTRKSGLLEAFLKWEWRWSRRKGAVRAEFHLGPIPAGEIPTPQGPLPVFLEGRLDRVDRGEEGLIIIDYKTGADARVRCYRGWGFQLPLYAALVSSELEQPVADAFFLAVRFPQQVQPERLRMPASSRAEHWLSLMDFYRGRLIELTTRLYQGDFPPTLMGRSLAGCTFCDYREICRYDGRQAGRLTRSGKLFTARSLLESGQWVGIPEVEN